MSNITYTSEQKDSNVGKALEYFSNIPTKSNEKNNKLYVVGHSLFMKSLWKKYNLVDDEHKKEIMKENVWDLIFDYHNNTTNITKNITFTRHAFSVANMYKERSSFKGNKPFIDQQLENDTKLSLYGILSALKISSMKKDITLEEYKRMQKLAGVINESAQSDELSKEIDKSSNRLSYGMIISALIVAGALVINTGTPIVIGLPLLSLLLFGGAATVGFLLIISILKEVK